MRLILLLLFVLSIKLQSEVVINEIIPSPDSPENEWIELYVFDNAENLSSYTISDLSGTKTLPDIFINADSYVILTKSESELRAIRSIPEDAIIIEMTIPSLNNAEDALILRGENSYDSLFYESKDYSKGKSIERINHHEPFIAGNYAISDGVNGATCGYKNSHAKLNYDLNLNRATFYKERNIIEIEIINIGLINAIEFQVNLSQNSEIFYFENFINLKSRDTILLSFEFVDFVEKIKATGYLEIKAEILFAEDEKKENNSKSFNIYVSDKNQNIKINEILFDTEGNNFEFVELFNLSESEIDLNNWRLYDAATDYSSGIVIADLIIKANSYALIAWDSSILERHPQLTGVNNYYISAKKLSLNKTYDDVSLSDPNGFVVDSVSYSDKWHEDTQAFIVNISLEKYSPELASNAALSWTSSADRDGSTPGEQNSVYTKIKYSGALSASPNPFSPEGEFNENQCFITYKLPFQKARINARIFTKDGIETCELENNLYSSDEGIIIWNGTDKDGFVLPVGAYVLYLEAMNLEKNEMFIEKIVVVIGKK